MKSNEHPTYLKWKESVLDPSLERAPETRKEFKNSSGLEISRVSLPNTIDNEYLAKLGLPGTAPFTRGIHPTMYRSRLWTMRQYAGFGTATESNQRYHELLSKGGTGLSVAFDLPTQIGMDSDHPLSAGEVGKVGVAIDSLADMETLFKGIPLDRVSTSMTINAPASILLAMYAVVAEKQGASWSQLRGTVQNDILKEYVARGTYIYPPKPSLGLTGELIAWCNRNTPKFNPISISGYHIREAGSTAAQEIAITLSNAICYLETALSQNLTVDDIAPRLSFFFAAASDLFEEVAKFRVARRIWASIVKDRFGAKKPQSMLLRFHVQTAGHTLAAQQIDNNISRVTLQALSAILGGAQSIHTNAKDEAIELPTTENAATALRIQQILAFESGVAKTVDPLGGSYFIEELTDQLETEIHRIMDQIQKAGGSLQATESGFIQRIIDEAAFRQQREVDSGERIVVGVNKFQSPKERESESSLRTQRSNTTAEQSHAIKALKRNRDAEAVNRSLEEVEAAAKSNKQIMPPILNAVRSYATVGEISDRLRKVYGEHDSQY